MQRARDSRGASAVEYALLVALIAAVMIVSVNALEVVMRAEYTSTCEDVGRAPGTNC